MTDPRAAFFSLASTCALKAKVSKLSVRDRLKLAEMSIVSMRDEVECMEALSDFIDHVTDNPVSAAERFQSDLEHLFPNDDPRRPERVLDEIEQERHDWQDRADLQ
ncbi:hypothetical protein [Halocynthiibacter sp.]|uniref:hypothetical protein n=1 Tax=Halocynthiibacter sp. TaxID=1979210 RepID=UPI003C65D314